MGGTKKRAGLFIVDRDGNTCCVLRYTPYVPFIKRSVTQTSTPTARDVKQQCPSSPVIENPGQGENIESDTVDSTFLEMMQIPRGSKERNDSDLIYTAVREFCEETLCANSFARVSESPIRLYWDDCGKRWVYNIYVATVNTRLYFAFDPKYMYRKTLTSCAGNGNRYTVYEARIISDEMTHVYSKVVVLRISDYIHYMLFNQLRAYGDNNYEDFFYSLIRSGTLTCDESSRIERYLNIYSTMKRGPCNTTPSNTAITRIVSGARTINVVTENMYRCIKHNRDRYCITFFRSAYSNMYNNTNMKHRWHQYWRSMNHAMPERAERNT